MLPLFISQLENYFSLEWYEISNHFITLIAESALSLLPCINLIALTQLPIVCKIDLYDQISENPTKKSLSLNPVSIQYCLCYYICEGAVHHHRQGYMVNTHPYYMNATKIWHAKFMPWYTFINVAIH